MVRPKKNRIVKFNPNVSYFKPRGIPMMDLEETTLTVDEREAIRLADLEGLSHQEAGVQMGVSRATFGRIIQNARKVVATALINGMAIRVEGGTYEMAGDKRAFRCTACSHNWEEPFGTGRPPGCPKCSNTDFYRIGHQTP